MEINEKQESGIKLPDENKIENNLKNNKPINKIKIPLIIIIGLFLLSGLLFSGWQFFSNLNKPNISGKIKLVLTAANMDSAGIKNDSSFILKSTADISEKKIANLIKFNPEIKYSVIKKTAFMNLFHSVLAQSENDLDFHAIYEIKPEEKLDEGKVYKIFTATATDIVIDHPYSWAFQVKAQFAISSTFPGDKATDVPINTGIEIAFNRQGISDPNQFFEIKPAVDGKFEKSSDKFIFIPAKKLETKKIYSITIKQGFKAINSEDILQDNYQFSFETNSISNPQEAPYFNWGSDMYQYTPDKNPVLSIYENNIRNTNLQIAVFKFNSGEDFADSYLKIKNDPLNWSYYNKNFYYDSAKEKEIFNFKPTIVESNYKKLIELPQKLDEGYYLLDTIFSGERRQAWLQISSLSYYYSLMDESSLIWIYDFVNKKPVNGTNIYFIGKNGAEEKLSVTNQDGLAEFSTPADLKQSANKNDKQAEFNYDLRLFKAEMAGSQAIYIPSSNNSIPEGDMYWKYISTDRYVYQMNDKINFWGIIKGRKNDLRQKKVQASLFNYQHNGDLAVTEAVVSSFNTIHGQLEFKGLPPSIYQLQIKYNDEIISMTDIEVLSYSKPAYEIKVTASKNKIFAGEKASFKVKASFFDQTPVAGLKVSYYGNWKDEISGEIILDNNGEGTFSYTPEYYNEETEEDDGTYYPQSFNINFSPSSAEEGEITGSAQVLVFGPKIYLQAFTEEKEKDNYLIKAKANRIVLSDNSLGTTNDEYIGDPVAEHTLNAKIIKITYTQVEDGQYYDPIYKVTRKTYRYDRKVETIETLSGKTDNKGEWTFSKNYPQEKNIYYKVIFTGSDEGNKLLKRSVYASFYYSGFADAGLGLNLNIKDKSYEESYKDGDNVKITATTYGSDQAPDNKILFYRFQNNIQMTKVQDAYNFEEKFSSEFLPSVQYRAVILGPYGFVESNDVTAKIEKKEKELQIDLKSDKDSYKPQENIKIDVNIKDNNGQGIKSEVNLAAVDESLFHVLPYNFQPDILSTYYANIYTYPVTGYSRYNPPTGGAERGGCFLAGTNILMADKSDKKIEDVKIGDQIMTLTTEYSGFLAKATVQGISSHLVSEYLLINNNLKVTSEHKIFLNNRWDYAINAQLGDWLVDDTGMALRIKSISKILSPKSKVYNIVVGKYHTYFADGIYVHNAEKGGSTRSEFVDVPLFKTIATDDQGLASADFKAPDNITSWRLTVKAFSPETMLVGETAKLIPVSLPLFIDTTLNEEYLTGDSPIIRLRAYGASYQSQKPVEFTLKGSNMKINSTSTSERNTIYIPLGELNEGDYKLVAGVKQNDLTDAMEKNVKIVKNYFRKAETSEYILNTDLKNITGNKGGYTKLQFMDAGKGKFFSGLLGVFYEGGIRADQNMASWLANGLLIKHFGWADSNENLDLSKYYKPDGAIALFPYGGADLPLSAKLADASEGAIYKTQLSGYFKNSLADKLADIHRISISLYGLASLGEPVLSEINYIKESKDLTFEDKIYIALGLVKLGDAENARTIYSDNLKRSLRIEGEEAWLDNEKDETVKVKLTATLGILASYLNEEETSEKIWNYISTHNPEKDLDNLEQVMMAKNMLAVSNQVNAGFNYKTSAKSEKVSLKDGNSYEIVLSEEELKTLSFNDINGDIRLISYYEKSVDPSSLLKNQDLAITRKFLVNNKETKTFKEGETVLVRLKPFIAERAIDGQYQVIDYLPSGLKPVIMTYNADTAKSSLCDPTWYPLEIIGNTIYFGLDKNFNKIKGCKDITLNYYARVVSRGKYQAQPAVIQSLNNIKSLNISQADFVEIK